jgi:hypothetical protein
MDSTFLKTETLLGFLTFSLHLHDSHSMDFEQIE